MTCNKQQGRLQKHKSESNLKYLISQLSTDETDLSELEVLRKRLESAASSRKPQSAVNTLPTRARSSYEPTDNNNSSKSQHLKHLVDCLNSEEARSLNNTAEHCRRQRRKSHTNNYYLVRIKDYFGSSRDTRKYYSGIPQQTPNKSVSLTIEKQAPVSFVSTPDKPLLTAVICQLEAFEYLLNLGTVCTFRELPIWPKIHNLSEYPLMCSIHFNPDLGIYFLRGMPTSRQQQQQQQKLRQQSPVLFGTAICVRQPEPLKHLSDERRTIYRANTRSKLNRRRHVQSEGEIEIKIRLDTDHASVANQPQALNINKKQIGDQLFKIEDSLVRTEMIGNVGHRNSMTDLDNSLILVKIVKKPNWPNLLGMQLEQLEYGKFRIKGFSQYGVVRRLPQLELKNLVNI